MINEEKCGIEKIESILKKNNNDFKDLNYVSEIMKSEFWMESCIGEDDKFTKYLISSNKADEFVTPIRNNLCDVSLGTHTHPENIKKGYEGVSEPSIPDKIFSVEKLLDPDDPMVAFCTQGIKDKKIKCNYNLKKIGCSEDDKIIDLESLI